ncbi:dTMP kinase [candidate division Kazan bacterium RBG_13_50_9]|uniref:Thymidylate kinase n=1 Tax=candidate division Kazan bacterium RBG_13_50_9 TaxID=1798535 RepID=A0A1F4NSA0_UNCK3|nr:MAG: dTMP kinase [candidate division Kazan bacterium RBG_13_50_9]
MQSKFIVFEGIDGSGQSTQAKLLADYLMSHDISVWLTKEPTLESEAGQRIKKILKGELPAPADPLEMQRLYVEDRRHHVNKIQGRLATGDWVISDRYLLSTIAYGAGMGGDYQQLIEMNQGFPVPDLVFYLDLDPKLAMERIHGRGRGQEFFEYEDKLRRIREIYLRLRDNYPNIKTIDGSKSIEEVSSMVRNLLMLD